jgi:hypothetical protein
MVNRATASTIGIVIAVISFAPNEGCARSAGAGGATAHGAVGLGAPRPINRGLGTGLGGSRFSAIPRSEFRVPRRDHRFRAFGFPVWPLEDCGGCYGAAPYDYGAAVYDYGAAPYIYGAAPYGNDVTSSLYSSFLLPPHRRPDPSEVPSPVSGNTSNRVVTGDDLIVTGLETLPRGRWHVLPRPRPSGD